VSNPVTQEPESNEASPPAEHTALTADVRSEVATIESIIGECTLALAGSTDEFAKGLALARGMRLLRAAFTPQIMCDVLELCGNPLGFAADRPNAKDGPYKPEEIRDCVIQAQLLGARLVGGEFTIVSRRAYLNKQFYERKLRELEGFADLDLQAGVPVVAPGGGALVPMAASWRMNGTAYSLERMLRKAADGSVDDRRIPVRVNNGQGADAAVGKATRKLLAQIYRRLTGSELTDDHEDPATVNGQVVQDVLAQEAAGEEVQAAPADSSDQESGGFDYSDLLTAYDAKIQAAVEANSIVDCGKARAWAFQQGDVPADVRSTIEMVHLNATMEIKSRRGNNAERHR
jgi:hypothetical protein